MVRARSAGAMATEARWQPKRGARVYLTVEPMARVFGNRALERPFLGRFALQNLQQHPTCTLVRI